MTNANGAGVKQNSDQNSDGAIIGQTASDKVGFHGEAVVQHSTNESGSIFDISGTTVTDNTQFNGGTTGPTGKGFYNLQAIVKALKDKGILAQDGGSTGQE